MYQIKRVLNKFLFGGIFIFISCCSLASLTEHTVKKSSGFPQLLSGKHRIVINHDGEKREVYIEIPTSIDKREKFPVVFGFHGASGKGLGYHNRLSPYVKSKRIISISPTGGKSRSGNTLWNFKKRSKSNSDDVGLVKRIISSLVEQELVDETRIFATGGSSGGLFAYRLAKETQLFSAIAPTKCGMTKNAHEPDKETRKTSIFQVIGDKDKSFKGSNKNFAQMYSAKERINIWQKFNQCSAARVKKLNRKMTLNSYVCEEEKKVMLLTLHGIGHSIGGELRSKMDAMIMNFFEQH